MMHVVSLAPQYRQLRARRGFWPQLQGCSLFAPSEWPLAPCVGVMDAGKAHGGVCMHLGPPSLAEELQTICDRCGQTGSAEGQRHDRATEGKQRQRHLPFKLNSMLGSALAWRLGLRELFPRPDSDCCAAAVVVRSALISIEGSKSAMGPLLISKKSVLRNAENSSAGAGSSRRPCGGES